jgi:hypothetical protein
VGKNHGAPAQGHPDRTILFRRAAPIDKRPPEQLRHLLPDAEKIARPFVGRRHPCDLIGAAMPFPLFHKSNVKHAHCGDRVRLEDGTLWVDYQDKNYFRILEAECIKSKIALDIVVYFEKNDKLHFIDSISRKPYDFSDCNIISSMFIVANLEIPPEKILRHLTLYKKPVAVLDVVGGWELSSRYCKQRQHVQLFTATTSRIPPERGRQVSPESRPYHHRFHFAVS